jgi:hypothetical protein
MEIFPLASRGGRPAECSLIVLTMPNLRTRNWKPLSSLKKGEVLEFECGRCHRTGLVTLLQLIRRNISLDTPIDELARKSFCKRCGWPDRRNRVRVRNGRD